MAKYRPFPLVDQAIEAVPDETLGHRLKQFTHVRVVQGWTTYNPAMLSTIRKFYDEFLAFVNERGAVLTEAERGLPPKNGQITFRHAARKPRR